MSTDLAILAFPMHGQAKLGREGYRTRDGHLIEWMGRQTAGRGLVGVVSRPEPRARELLLRVRSRGAPSTLAKNTEDIRVFSNKLPNLFDRRKWWLSSLNDYPTAVLEKEIPIVSWNPMIAVSNLASALRRRRDAALVFDMLDDWTQHFAFASIRQEVCEAYRAIFELATHVTANGEGALALAHEFGRSDAELITNGCDPGRFPTESLCQGPTTVGYVGKIGKRLDLSMIEDVTAALPDVRFVFAGPVLDQSYRRPLGRIPNLEMLGDVAYPAVPKLLQTFDLGWVPHFVGNGEVGGDVIKTYEYRAAGLPVISTPITGAGSRGLDGVFVAASAAQHIAHIRSLARADGRIPRSLTTLPTEMSWEYKARRLLDLLGA